MRKELTKEKQVLDLARKAKILRPDGSNGPWGVCMLPNVNLVGATLTHG
jgi:hypothetical protein